MVRTNVSPRDDLAGGDNLLLPALPPPTTTHWTQPPTTNPRTLPPASPDWRPPGRPWASTSTTSLLPPSHPRLTGQPMPSAPTRL